MFTEFQKNKAELTAFRETIANHTVGILTHAGQGVGTGTLVRYGANRVILTAHHVLDSKNPLSLRIAFRPGGNLQEAPLRSFGAAPTPLLSGELIKASGVIDDRANDIAAIVLAESQQVREPAAFYDATGVKEVSPYDGASLFFMGFPVDNAIDLGPTDKALGAVADYLAYDSNLNNLRGLPSSYDPNKQFLMKYSWEGQLLPHGLSGSSVWCALTPSPQVWTAKLVLFGVVLAWVKKLEVLIAANQASVLQLLSRI